MAMASMTFCTKKDTQSHTQRYLGIQKDDIDRYIAKSSLAWRDTVVALQARG
jgi:hypothetical protein